MLPTDLADLLDRQSGVVSRAQVLDLGLTTNDLRRLVRRRDLTRVHPGVFVDHTGVPSWTQHAWAAVLHAWPAVLCDASALRTYGLDVPDQGGEVEVLVAADRHPRAPDGVRIHRSRDMSDALWHASPPRLRLEAAVVRVVARAPDEHVAVRVLTDAVGSRRTTPARLQAVMDRTPRLARRALLTGVLADAAEGTHSVLERGWLHRVERPHGLPRSTRQARGTVGGRAVYRDVVISAYGVVVELDGRAHHGTTAARHRDLDRDLAAAADGWVTVRLAWGQVMGDPCGTVQRLGALLRLRGWPGEVGRCPDCSSS